MEDISLPFFSMKKIHYLLSTCIFPALPLSFNQSIIHTVSSSESFLSLIDSHGNRHHFPRLLSGPLRHAGICLYITNFPLYLFPSLFYALHVYLWKGETAAVWNDCGACFIMELLWKETHYNPQKPIEKQTRCSGDSREIIH